MNMHKIILNEERNVSLSCFIQDVGGEYGQVVKRPAILILPGGGYSMCSDREAEPIAFSYLQAGFQAFVLRYSVGEHRAWPNPLNDYEHAMTLLLENADAWHIQPDKIAVIGFSAGGHLAACAATVAKHRPSAAILGYAAISKDIVDMCQPGMPYPAQHVSGDTCPCFLFAARDDSLVPTSNNLEFESALSDHGIQFESHIYAYGGHGFSTGDPYLYGGAICNRASHWVRDSIDWIWDVFGSFTTEGFGSPTCAGKLNSNREATLSADCTLGHLLKQSEAVQELLQELLTDVGKTAAQRSVSADGLLFALRMTPLRELMRTLGHSSEATEQLDAQLKQFPNAQ